MSFTVRDSFTDTAGVNLTAHVGETAASWSKHPAASSGANILISAGGRAYAATISTYVLSSEALYLASGAAAADDHDVAVNRHFYTYGTDVYTGILFRYHATNDSGYRLVYRTYSAFRYWVLEKVTAGAATTVGDVTYAEAPAFDSDASILIECRSTGIVVKFDGVTKITSSDTTFLGSSQRRVGLYAIGDGTGSDSAGIHFDLLTVADPGNTTSSDDPGYVPGASILHKRSATVGKVPTSAHLVVGELAICTGDAAIFTKRVDGTVIQVGGPGGVGGSGSVQYNASGSRAGASKLAISTNGNAVLAQQSSPTTVDGELHYGTEKSLRANLDGGLVHWIAATIYSQTSGTTVQNSTVEGTLLGSGLGTYALPANYLVLGKTLRLNLRGVYSSAGSPGTLTIRVKLGTTTLCTCVATLAASVAPPSSWDVDVLLTCLGVGGSGSIRGQGWFGKYEGSGVWTRDAFPWSSPAAIDTSVSGSLGVTAQFSVANAANLVTCTNATIETLI